MRKISLLAASFTILAILSTGIFNPALAQHKPMKQGGERLKMMQEKHPMQKKNRPQKKMKMSPESAMHMRMMTDPVLRTLHNFGCPGFLLENAEKLGLDEKQKETLTNLQNEFKKVAIKTDADIKVAMVDMKQAMSKDQPDYAAAQKAINQIEQLKKQLHEKFFSTLKEGRKVLTADQLKKMQALNTGSESEMPMEEEM